MGTDFVRTITRRRFVQSTVAAIAASRIAFSEDGWAKTAEDLPNTHNMLVVGGARAYLSHLPMFHRLDHANQTFSSPHRYQMILEGTFHHRGKDVTGRYFEDRRANPLVRIYTLNPEEFVLPHLFTSQAKPRLSTFAARVFRGHLEQGGMLIDGLDEVSVHVTRVVHARMFDPKVKKPAALEYLLFGRGDELFVAHAIFAPPDFDQVLTVKVAGVELRAEDLEQEIRIAVADRKNDVRERLRENQRVDAVLQIGRASTSGSKVQLETGPEFYFEEGELLVPPTFDPTDEEKRATRSPG